MIQSFAKTGWVGLLSISLCVQMAWAVPFNVCECAHAPNAVEAKGCRTCVASAALSPTSNQPALSLSSGCCCSMPIEWTGESGKTSAPQGGTATWTYPRCDCGLLSSLPVSQGMVPELTWSPSDAQPSMVLSAAPWSAWCLRGSPTFRANRSAGPPRQFSQATLCVWQI